MLRLPPFEYRVAASVEEAASILAGEGPEARLVAGGTDLWPNMKRRHQKARVVVSLMRIPELREIRNGSGEPRIGATALLDEVARHPLLGARYPAFVQAVESISSPPLRNMGTIGGNLCVDTRCTYYTQTEEWRRSIDYCLKEEGTVCWVAPGSSRCWAHAASDAAPILCALGARVRLLSQDGERVVPIDTLYRDDGIDYLAKRPDEVLTEILLPPEADAARCRSAFLKLRRRGSIDFAVLSCGVAVWTSPDGTVERARIVLGAVASGPAAAESAAAFLTGKRLDEEAIARAAKLAREAATPMDNTDFQAQWRNAMVARYTAAALREITQLPARPSGQAERLSSRED